MSKTSGSFLTSHFESSQRTRFQEERTRKNKKWFRWMNITSEDGEPIDLVIKFCHGVAVECVGGLFVHIFSHLFKNNPQTIFSRAIYQCRPSRADCGPRTHCLWSACAILDVNGLLIPRLPKKQGCTASPLVSSKSQAISRSLSVSESSPWPKPSRIKRGIPMHWNRPLSRDRRRSDRLNTPLRIVCPSSLFPFYRFKRLFLTCLTPPTPSKGSHLILSQRCLF